MNDAPRTPAPDFQDQLNALAEEMADGLRRQAAIDRLVELGLSEEEADDQEASIREQLRAIQHGARAIFRDLENGLERRQAVLRLQELGLGHADAVVALDGFLERQRTAQQEAKQVLEAIDGGMAGPEALSRFRELGLAEPLAVQIVGLRRAVTAHWYAEQVWLGGLTAGIGAALLLLLLFWYPTHLVGYLIPGSMLLYGLFFAFYGRRQRRRLLGAAAEGSRPFELVKQGHGRRRAIVHMVERRVSAAEATVLVDSSLQGVVRIYRWFVALGAVAAAWGLFQAWAAWGAPSQPAVRSLGALALVFWGGTGVLRGLIGWRRFAKR